MNMYRQINKKAREIRNSDIAFRLTSGAFWLIIGNIIGRGLLLVAFIIVARILTKEEYGELSMIRSTIVMFSTFATAGIGLTASRYIAFYRNTDQQKTHEIYLLSHYTSIGLGFIISGVLYFCAPAIAEGSLHTPSLTSDLRIASLMLFAVMINSAQNGTLSGFERFKTIAINTSITGVFQLLLLSFGAYYWGLSGVIVGLGIAALAVWIMNHYSIKTSVPANYRKEKNIKISKDAASILWKFSLPAVISSILVVPTLWWCKTLVIQVSGFESMANYDVAEQWNTIILFIPAALSGMLVPVLSNLLAKGSQEQYLKTIKINIWINTLITVFTSVALCLLTSVILKGYGVEFTDKNTFRILILSTIPNAMASVIGNTIASKGKMWTGFVLNFLWSIWLIAFSILFVKKMQYGATGLALAFLIAYILHAIVSYIYIRSLYGKGFPQEEESNENIHASAG
jgi:O-antigen/teichoic acid export membrane protein